MWNCLNVGDNSQRFSCQCSKSQLSQCIAYAIIWLKVMGLEMVNIRSFTFPRSPNWNWFMSTTLSPKMSHVSCLNSKMYTKASCDPCKEFTTCLLLYILCLNRQKKHQFFQKNASKSFRIRYWRSKIGVNYVKVVLNNKVLMIPTWVQSFG